MYEYKERKKEVFQSGKKNRASNATEIEIPKYSTEYEPVASKHKENDKSRLKRTVYTAM